MRVCVYGSSSKQTPKNYLDAAFRLGELLAERGHVCVNGGGNAGCMGAVNEGCKKGKGRIICVIHEIFLVDKEEFVGADEILVATGDNLAERKRLLNEGADCIIVLPGGAGTFDELWESCAAVGLGFINIPIICVNTDGFYEPFHSMLLQAQRDKLIYKGPEELLRFAPDAATALNLAERLHAEGQAQRGDASQQSTAMRPGAFFLGGARVVKKDTSWRYNRYLGAKRGFLSGLVVGVAAVLMLQRLWRAR